MYFPDIVVVPGVRTPIGQFKGVFSSIPATTLAQWCLQTFPDALRHNVTHLYAGCVYSHALGQHPARILLTHTGLPLSTDTVLINRVCGSGMQSFIEGWKTLSLKPHAIVMAGGMENMSRVPFCASRQLPSFGDAILYDGLMDGLQDYNSRKVMGYLAERTAAQHGITRVLQENYVITSAHNAAKAYANGFFQQQYAQMPETFSSLSQDEPFQRVNVEKIPFLKPAFEGTITAATAAALADGASFSPMMTRETAEKRGYHGPHVYWKDYVTYANMAEDFAFAPCYAITALLKKCGWCVSEVDFFEVNEAFAVVPLLVMQHLNIPREKMNIYGGACVMGHPLGMSGARIMTHMTHLLHHHQAKKGIVSVCIGGGEAIAVALERRP